MIDRYRVLLPKWIFVQAKNAKEREKYIFDYLQRYPHYIFLCEENGFAICERRKIKRMVDYE